MNFGKLSSAPTKVKKAMLPGTKLHIIWDMRIKKSYSKKADVRETMNGTKAADPTGDAEDFMSFWTRVEQGFLHVINRHRETGGNVLIVAHGNTIRNIVHELEPSMDEAVILDNASVTVLAYENGLFKLERLNDTSHFKKA